MSVTLLTLVILGPAAVVVAALFLVLWRERTSTRDARIAIVSAGALSLWAVVATVLAYRGVFQPQDVEAVPPVGINLIVVLSVLFASLATFPSLRRLLTRQANLIRLHLWRLVGVVFLVLMVRGQVPALWALPAGIGDILVAVTAPWVARDVDTPRRQASSHHLESVRHRRPDRRRRIGNHDEPWADAGVRDRTDIGTDDALPDGAGADIPGAARVRASRDFVVAVAG